MSLSSAALADPCPTNLPNPVYGSGGSAVTATIGAVATALAGLPDPITILYWDPGACTGYHAVVDKDTGSGLASPPAYFKYWDATGKLTQCEATGNEPLAFAHMGNTPALCPANQPLPAGFGRFVAPVQTINYITHKNSQYDSISAEALYHVYGFGPGAASRSVTPWTNPNAVFARKTDSFVHQITAKSVGLSPTGFVIPETNFPSQNPQTVQLVFEWGEANDPNLSLGYVSGSAADKGTDDGQIKTLALQHYGQSCGYLPDSSRTRKDKKNVRSGQYALWTPAWFYTKVNGSGGIVDPNVENLVRWFDGSRTPPAGLDIVKLIIQSGDIPLCAMQANRPDGDLNAIVSYAPADPCNGYFEYVATGSTTLASCTTDANCNVAGGEKCRHGFCEAY